MTRREANTAILAGAAVLVAGPASASRKQKPSAVAAKQGRQAAHGSTHASSIDPGIF